MIQIGMVSKLNVDGWMLLNERDQSSGKEHE